MTADASRELVTVVDPGHGGAYDGARCYRDVLREKDLTLKVGLAAKRLRPGLLLTRDEDVTLSLEERNAIANDVRADLVIPVHFDWVEDDEGNRIPERHGMAVFFWLGPSAALTQHLAWFALSNAPRELVGGLVFDQGYSPGVRAVLAAFDAPTVLIECAYLSNEGDVRYIETNEGIEALARVVLAVDDRFRKIMESLDGS